MFVVDGEIVRPVAKPFSLLGPSRPTILVGRERESDDGQNKGQTLATFFTFFVDFS